MMSNATSPIPVGAIPAGYSESKIDSPKRDRPRLALAGRGPSSAPEGDETASDNASTIDWQVIRSGLLPYSAATATWACK
jgi:hypothetical protein